MSFFLARSLSCKSNSFPYERLFTKTRFEKEATRQWLIDMCFGLTSRHLVVIGSKISRHFVIQSEVKPKPIEWLPRARFPALCVSYSVHVFASSSDWFTELGVSFVSFSSQVKIVMFFLPLCFRRRNSL